MKFTAWIRAISLMLTPFLLGCPARIEPVAPGMNVLLITLDTTRADALGCYGAPGDRTPHIDRLAREGVRFPVAYSSTNVTNPSHLSIMTGLRSIEHGVFYNKVVMPSELESLPVAFRRAGYATAGLPAVPFLASSFGWQGFDELDEPRENRKADRMASRAIEWIDGRRDDRPFFLWVHFFDPHVLYSPPAEIARQYYRGDPRQGDGPLLTETRSIREWDYPPMHRYLEGIRDPGFPKAMYAGEIHFTDRNVGRILEHLEKSGLADTTVVALTADHGESLGEHGIYYDHFNLFEQNVRVPLLIRVPGQPPGREPETPVTLLDLAPTLAELCGVPFHQVGDGLSLVPLLVEGGRFRSTRSPEKREYLILEAARNKMVAVRKGRWKLIWPIDPKNKRHDVESALFDLESDPREEQDVQGEHPEVVKELVALVEEWIELGGVKGTRTPIRNEEVLRQLREVGYIKD